MVDGKPTTVDVMSAYATDAVEHARTACNVVLDYSSDSVREVERVLDIAHSAIPRGLLARLFRRGPSEDDVRKLSMMYGGYLGEVLKRCCGGEWAEHPEHGLAFTKDNHVIFPHARVRRRLINGKEDDVWAYFQIIASDLGDA